MLSNPGDRKPMRHQGTGDADQAAGSIVSKIPHRYIVGLGKVLGRAAYVLDAPHRRIVRRNLHFAHPHWTRKKVDTISRRVFQNLGISLVEFIQTTTLSRNQLLGRLRVVGLENLQAALENKKGLIIVSAHLGSWETGLLFMCCHIQQPILGIAKKIRFAALNRWVLRMRSQYGLRIVYKKGAMPEMRRMLRQGGVVGLLVDQSRRSEGVDVNFFGHRVTTTPSAAFLSIRCKSPVLPMFCVRDPNGRLTVIVQPALEMKRTGDLRSNIQTNTQMITDVVEKFVRRYPEQWFWVHKRWKKYYPDLYPEYQARRLRRHRKKGRI
jgi:KDO2-lipid IV(A) lauroyltransferase